MSEANFYQKHLERVSRSFAFCIARLEGPLKTWVSSTYLVCRILDTVEDANWGPLRDQIRQFEKFNLALNDPLQAKQLEAWASEFPTDIPAGERALLTESNIVFKDFHGFPAKVKKVIQDAVGSMSAGMRYFSELKNNGQLKINNIQQLNQYCFFVAGVVGEVLTELLEADPANGAENASTVSPRLSLVQAHHFGLFLQKVNILKDQRSDESLGRFFVPSYQEVYESLDRNLIGAWKYFASLQDKPKGYRLFCGWSLFLGVASLPYIKKSFEQKSSDKISRAETLILLSKIESSIDNIDQLRKIFDELLLKAGKNLMLEELEPQRLVSAKKSLLFDSLYKGKLSPQDLSDLDLPDLNLVSGQ